MDNMYKYDAERYEEIRRSRGISKVPVRTANTRYENKMDGDNGGSRSGDSSRESIELPDPSSSSSVGATKDANSQPVGIDAQNVSDTNGMCTLGRGGVPIPLLFFLVFVVPLVGPAIPLAIYRCDMASEARLLCADEREEFVSGGGSIESWNSMNDEQLGYDGHQQSIRDRGGCSLYRGIEHPWDGGGWDYDCDDFGDKFLIFLVSGLWVGLGWFGLSILFALCGLGHMVLCNK